MKLWDTRESNWGKNNSTNQPQNYFFVNKNSCKTCRKKRANFKWNDRIIVHLEELRIHHVESCLNRRTIFVVTCATTLLLDQFSLSLNIGYMLEEQTTVSKRNYCTPYGILLHELPPWLYCSYFSQIYIL